MFGIEREDYEQYDKAVHCQKGLQIYQNYVDANYTAYKNGNDAYDKKLKEIQKEYGLSFNKFGGVSGYHSKIYDLVKYGYNLVRDDKIKECPAWTDRILHKTGEHWSSKVLSYDVMETELSGTDHKPVCLTVTLRRADQKRGSFLSNASTQPCSPRSNQSSCPEPEQKVEDKY